MPDFDQGFITRLQAGVEASRQFLSPYRQERAGAIQRFVGPHYGRSKSKPVPINVDHMAVSVLLPIIVGGQPKVKITPKAPALQPFAKTFELACNHVYDEMDIERTYTLVALDALFMAGFTKCGIIGADQHEAQGYLHDAGLPFIDRVDFDDMILDPNARTWEAQRFCGNKFRMPLARAKDIYGNVDGLRASYRAYGPDNDIRADEIGTGKLETLNELEDYVELAEIWLPIENVILTIPCDPSMGRVPLSVIVWEGPERGPYEMLSFMPVSDNLLPVAPAAVWKDTSTLINSIARKLKRQAERSKNIGVFEKANQEDATAIRDSDDGEMVGVMRADSVKALALGGADPNAVATLDYFLRLNSKQAGNIDLVGGLEATGGTATETIAQSQAAGGRVEWYKRCIRTLAKHDAKKVAFYLWNDPLVGIEVQKPVPGMDDLSGSALFSQDTQEGDWLDYNIDIEPYSMHPRTPEQKAQAFREFVGGYIMPLAPLAAAQGLQLNIQRLIQRGAAEEDIENVDGLFDYALPQAQMQAEMNSPVRNAPQGQQQPRPTVNVGGFRQQPQRPQFQRQPQPQPRPQEATANAGAM